MSRTGPERLTANQRQLLARLVEYQAREGLPPNVRKMQALAGFRSPLGVVQFLEALEKAGYIQRTSGAHNVRILRRPIGVEIPDRAHTVLVPIIGEVAAGRPRLSAENIEGYLPVATSLARGRWNYFLLRVRGDSMDRAGIRDGDLVLVRKQDTADHGDRVVALIDDSATVKRLRAGRDAVLLEPVSTNPAH